LSHRTTEMVQFVFTTVRKLSVFAALTAVHTEGHTKHSVPNSDMVSDKSRVTHDNH